MVWAAQGWRPCLPVRGSTTFRLFGTLGKINCPLFCLALTECLDRFNSSFDGSVRSCRRSRYSRQVVPCRPDMFVVCLPSSSETTRRARRRRHDLVVERHRLSFLGGRSSRRGRECSGVVRHRTPTLPVYAPRGTERRRAGTRTADDVDCAGLRRVLWQRHESRR